MSSANEEEASAPETPAAGGATSTTSVAAPPSPTPLDIAKTILSHDPALVIIGLGDEVEAIQQLREYGQQLLVYADASLKQLGKKQSGSSRQRQLNFLGKRKSSGGDDDRPNPNKRKHKANWKLIQECKDKVEEDQDIPAYRAFVEQLHTEFEKLQTSGTPQNGCVDVTTKRKTQCICLDMFVAALRATDSDQTGVNSATSDPQSDLKALLDIFAQLRQEGMDKDADDFYSKCHAILINHLTANKLSGRGLRDPMFTLKNSKEQKQMFCMRTLQNVLGFEYDKTFYEQCLKKFGGETLSSATPPSRDPVAPGNITI